MKKKDYYMIVLLISLIIVSAMIIFLIRSPSENVVLQIQVDHKIYGEYLLSKDQTIAINDTNVCIIKNQQVSMIQADCPDQICVHSKAIGNDGGTIICMPNHVILKIITKEVSTDAIAS